MTRRLAPLLVIALLVLVGCGGGEKSPGHPSTDVIKRYVALGDSYTAAPYVPNTDLANGCVRSDHNYPHLLAKQLKVKKLVDVSCGGASNANILTPQRTITGVQVPPQIDAVTRDTDLVTLGMGGNDNGLFAKLLATLCGVRGATCGSTYRAAFDAVLDQLDATLVRTISTVQTVAPKARIVLVGYPEFSANTTGCALIPAVSRPSVDLAVHVTQRLHQEMKAAAKQAGVTYVDVYDASQGHGICTKEPWVNGDKFERGAAAAFHPFPREQVAVAKLVAEAVKG